jgi:hypothetical protein
MLGELHGALRVEPLPWKRIAEITSDLPRVEIHSICAMQQGGQGGRLGRLSEYIYIYKDLIFTMLYSTKNVGQS